MIVFHKKKLDQELTLSMKPGESITISVSDSDTKSKITLSIDESRALRDFLKKAIKESDNNSFGNEEDEGESEQGVPMTEFYGEGEKEEFKLFKKEGLEDSEKQKTEFYY